MKIYRYEKEDGGGPFCYPNGSLREKPSSQMDNHYIYGCSSLAQLTEYFSGQEYLLEGCELKIYNIPDELVIVSKREVRFPKIFNPKSVSTIPEGSSIRDENGCEVVLEFGVKTKFEI